MRRWMAAALIAASCARTTIDRSHWQQMPATEKQLYVRSLLGHENVKKRKGGNELTFPESADVYVAKIDAAYSRGDARDVEAVFESLGERGR